MLSKEQLEERKSYIGGSDVAAILGVDPFKNVADVWAEKTGKLDDKEQKETADTKSGNYMETALLEYATDELGELIRNVHTAAEGLGFPLVTQSDAIVKSSGEPVEAKSNGLFSPDKWGQPGTDEVPDRVIAQDYAQMITTKKPICYSPVYLPVIKFQMFWVPFDRDLANTILENLGYFWNENVLKDIPPEAVIPPSTVPEVIIPSSTILRRFRREPKSIVEIPAELYARARADMDAAKEAKDKADQSKDILIAALGQAEAGVCESGMVTFYEQSNKGYVVSPFVNRVLRFKKN